MTWLTLTLLALLAVVFAALAVFISFLDDRIKTLRVRNSELRAYNLRHRRDIHQLRAALKRVDVALDDALAELDEDEDAVLPPGANPAL